MYKKNKKPKIYRKSVIITHAKLLDKDLQTKTPKWKRKIAKIFGIPVEDKYLYSYNIQYQGKTRLRPDDTIVSRQGMHFLVYKEVNRQAIIISATKTACEPFALGSFVILDLEKELKHQEMILKMQEQRDKDKKEEENNTKEINK